MIPPQRTTRVLVADDHDVVRAGVRHVLQSARTAVVVAEAHDAASTVRMAREHVPDVVVLDVAMPGGSGSSVIPALRRVVPDARIIMLTGDDEAHCVDECVRCGINGCLLKSCAANELPAAVAAVIGGRGYFSSKLTQLQTQPIESPRPREVPRASAPATVKVTDRERQVLSRVAEGQTSKQIAAELGISPRTVETHRESLTRKLGVSSVAGLIRYALENGLLSE